MRAKPSNATHSEEVMTALAVLTFDILVGFQVVPSLEKYRVELTKKLIKLESHSKIFPECSNMKNGK